VQPRLRLVGKEPDVGQATARRGIFENVALRAVAHDGNQQAILRLQPRRGFNEHVEIL